MPNPRKTHVGKTQAERREYFDNYVKAAAQEPTFDTVRPAESTTSVAPDTQPVQSFSTRPRKRGFEPVKKWFNEKALVVILTAVVVGAVGIVGYLWTIVFQLNREVGVIEQRAEDAKAAAREREDRLLKQIERIETRLDQANQQPPRRR